MTTLGPPPFSDSWMAKFAMTTLLLKEIAPGSWVSAYPSASIKIHHVLFIMRTAVIVPKLVKECLNDCGAVSKLPHNPNKNMIGLLYATEITFTRCEK
jgi:hypothetical protein